LDDDFKFELEAIDDGVDGRSHRRVRKLRALVFRARSVFRFARSHVRFFPSTLDTRHFFLIRRQPPRVLDPLDRKLLPFSPRVNSVACAQSFSEQVPQISFPREMLWRVENRIMQLPELDL